MVGEVMGMLGMRVGVAEWRFATHMDMTSTRSGTCKGVIKEKRWQTAASTSNVVGIVLR